MVLLLWLAVSVLYQYQDETEEYRVTIIGISGTSIIPN